MLVVGTALTLRREGGSSGRISSEAHVESGAAWSHLQESFNVSCLSSAAVLISARYQDNNLNDLLNETTNFHTNLCRNF